MGVKMNIVYAAIILIGVLCIANIYTIATYSAVFNEAITVTDYKTALQMDIIWGSKQKLPDAPAWFDTFATNPGAVLVTSLISGVGLVVVKKLIHQASNGKKGPNTDAVDKAAKNFSSPKTNAIASASPKDQADPKGTAKILNKMDLIEESGNSSERAQLRALTSADASSLPGTVKPQKAPKTMLEKVSDFLKGAGAGGIEENKGDIELSSFE